MAIELTTNSQRINYTTWLANDTQNYALYTLQYVYYEKINATTARVHVTQAVGSVSGLGWNGTNNHYRSRTGDWVMDSGYNQFGTIAQNSEISVWSGYYDVTSSTPFLLVCYADTYGGKYQTTSTTEVYVPASAFAVAPNTPTVSVDSVSSNSITLSYGTTSFGTPSTGTVTLYGGTSSSPTTMIDSYSSTGSKTFEFSGLNPETTYYFRAIASNGVLASSYSTEVSGTTLEATKLYGSVNGQTKRILKMYCSLNEETKEIKKLYGSVNGQTKRIL